MATSTNYFMINPKKLERNGLSNLSNEEKKLILLDLTTTNTIKEHQKKVKKYIPYLFEVF